MKHDNAFDALRLFAALLVIFGHAFRLTGEAEPVFAGVNVAATGVKIFFVVSGYLVAQSWLRDPHPGRFLRRRLLRIMPGLVAVVALTAFVLGPIITNLSVPLYFADQQTWLYLANLAFYPADVLPSVFTGNIAPHEVNGSLWSLAPELSMYLLLPVIAVISLMLTGAYRLFVLVALSVALVALVVVLPAPELRQWLIYGTRVWAWFSVAPFFLIGACFALCRWDRLLNRSIASGLLLMLLLVPTPPLLTEFLLIVSLPYIVLAFGTGPAPLGGVLTRQGDFSYGLYLYAFPIQQTLVATVGTPGGALGAFAMTTMLAGACAVLSWRMIEKPALRAKPNRAASGIPVGERGACSNTEAWPSVETAAGHQAWRRR